MPSSTTMPDPRSATSGPRRAGPGLAITIDSQRRAGDLAAWLLSPHRRRPAVVATVRQDAAPTVVDVEELAEQRGDRIDVYLIASQALAAVLGELLPDGCGVDGGAVRLYPATQAWHNHPDGAPLLQARDRGESDTLNSRLRAEIRSALRAASAEAATLAPRPSAVVAQLELDASGEPRAVASAAEGVALARHLLNPFREWPVVVITSHPDARGPYLPAASIAQDLQGVAAVVELTPDATYGLTDGLARRRLSAFHGAGRVYPLGRDWVQDPALAPLRICPDRAGAHAVAAELIADALTAARSAGLLARPAPGANVAGVVQGPLGEHHVLVSVPGHGRATLLAARLRPGVPADRLVSRGQQLQGRVRGDGPLPEFDPIVADDDPARRVRAAYRDGSVCLGKVANVGPDAATVLLHPDVPATLARQDGDPQLPQLLGVDDVIAVRVDWSGERPRAVLADPAGASRPLPAVSVLGEGPSWLVPADLEPEPAIQAAPTAAPEAHVVGPPAPDDELGRRLRVAQDAADQYAEELDLLRRRLEATERTLAIVRAGLRRAHTASQPNPAG